MRRVLAWLRHGRRLHADVTSGRYALRRENEALTAALAERTAQRDAAEAVVQAVRQWGPYTPRRVTAALAAYDEARAAQPQKDGT